MPVSFMYAIVMVPAALLAIVAPTMHGLSFALLTVFSVCLVLGGIYDLIGDRRAR